jgi:hypothetical protein
VVTLDQLIGAAQLLTIGIIPLVLTLHNANKRATKERWDDLAKTLRKDRKAQRRTAKKVTKLETFITMRYIHPVRRPTATQKGREMK